MAKALRWLAMAMGAIIILLSVAAGWIWISSSQLLARKLEGSTETLARPSAAQVADAPRQLRILGCVSCHGDGLRGKLMFSEPHVADVFAPNLTRIAGRASDQQLARALRQGIGIDGRPLFIMPSVQYSYLDDREIAALIGAIRALPKGGSDTPPLSVGPLGRIGLVNGKLRSQPQLIPVQHANAPADLGPRYAAGRKIVLTNCTECHGPDLQGAEPKPGLIAPGLDIVGAYDLEQFRTLLRTGVAPGNKKLELMDDVARNDFRYMRDEEIAQVHSYLVERAQRAP